MLARLHLGKHVSIIFFFSANNHNENKMHTLIYYCGNKSIKNYTWKWTDKLHPIKDLLICVLPWFPADKSIKPIDRNKLEILLTNSQSLNSTSQSWYLANREKSNYIKKNTSKFILQMTYFSFKRVSSLCLHCPLIVPLCPHHFRLDNGYNG